MRTSPIVDFSIYDPAIKQDSTPSASSIQAFSKIADLEVPNTNTAYATYEPDFWLLSGGYKLMPTDTTNVHTGWMSQAMSDADGLFSVSPVLTIIFGSVQSVDGLTLNFSKHTGDWATDIDVAYYDASNVLIQTDNYTPTTWEICTAEAVANFKKIIITFNATNKSYHYLRLQSIDYGQVIHFTETDIKSCTVIEQIDPTSLTLPASSLELNLFSSDAAFSITNPSGIYANLQSGQVLEVYELAGNSIVYIGHFYLNDWKNTSENTIKFLAVDTIGFLDGIPFPDTISINSGYTFGDILNSLDNISIPYSVDPTLATIEINGISRNLSYRQLLQQVALATGSVIDCTRSGVVNIYPFVLASDLLTFDNSISKSEKGINQELLLNPVVTGVEITSYEYIKNGIDIKLVDDVLDAGTYTVSYRKPVYFIVSITGGTIVDDNNLDFLVFSVASPGAVVVTVREITIVNVVHSVYNPSLPVNTRQNVIKITDGVFIGPDRGDEISQRIYDYYQQRYQQKMKLYAPDVKVGDNVLIDTLYDRQIGAIIEKMTLDLSGGFTAETEATGVIIPL